MITLKKAFETQNVLKTLLNSAEGYLKSEANVTQTIETHLKSKANANAQDETIVVPINSDIECSVEQVVDFCLHIAAEMETLTNAINAAKAKENYDGLVSANNTQRQLLDVVSGMAKRNSKENITTARGFAFNNDGNQTQYYYDKAVVTTINYDRTTIKAIEKKLRKTCEQRSDDLDSLLLTIKVDYKPIYSLGDTLEDALNAFIERAKEQIIEAIDAE